MEGRELQNLFCHHTYLYNKRSERGERRRWADQQLYWLGLLYEVVGSVYWLAMRPVVSVQLRCLHRDKRGSINDTTMCVVVYVYIYTYIYICMTGVYCMCICFFTSFICPLIYFLCHKSQGILHIRSFNLF